VAAPRFKRVRIRNCACVPSLPVPYRVPLGPAWSQDVWSDCLICGEKGREKWRPRSAYRWEYRRTTRPPGGGSVDINNGKTWSIPSGVVRPDRFRAMPRSDPDARVVQDVGIHPHDAADIPLYLRVGGDLAVGNGNRGLHHDGVDDGSHAAHGLCETRRALPGQETLRVSRERDDAPVHFHVDVIVAHSWISCRRATYPGRPVRFHRIVSHDVGSRAVSTSRMTDTVQAAPVSARSAEAADLGTLFERCLFRRRDGAF